MLDSRETHNSACGIRRDDQRDGHAEVERQEVSGAAAGLARVDPGAW